MSKKPDPLATLRRDLLAGGYEPILTDGKRPVETNWQKGSITPERLAAAEVAFPSARNTGLRTGRLVGGDIDLTDRAHAIEIEKIFNKTLGGTPFQRIGSKGCLLCYRNETPIAKITIGTRDKRLVEILGSGQQFIAYGVHPLTGTEYEWPNDFLGGEPVQTALSDLAAVTPEQLHDAAHAVAARLIALGYGDVTVSGIKTTNAAVKAISASSGKPVNAALVENMLRCIDPAGVRNAWLIVCGGLVTAPVTDPAWDGLDLFIRWSRGDLHGGVAPANYRGPDDCKAQWDRDLEKHHDR
jgi:hypothetical protein